MRTFKVQISFGTDSDKATAKSGEKETAYNIAVAVICVAGLIGWWL